ncbi:15444_t:CDS:1, partial [Dentiscutata heterogama]
EKNIPVNYETDFNDSSEKNILPETTSLVSSQFLSNQNISDAEENSQYDNSSDTSKDNDDLHQLAMDEFHWFCNDLQNLLEENDPILDQSICKFVKVYIQHRSIQDTHIWPAISSFFQTCNWNAGRVNGKSYQRGGKRIKVQVTAAARRRKGPNHGLKKLQQGRPSSSTYNNIYETETQEDPSRFIMPSRKKWQKRQAHDFQQALKEN